jgi:hypothetical protein
MKDIYMGVIVPFSILLPIFIALLKWKILPQGGKILFIYLVISGTINFAATIIGKVYHKNNLPLVHILTILEVIVLLKFYKKVLAHQHKQLVYNLAAILFIIICIGNVIFFQSIYTYCSYTRSIAAIIIMILSINYFAKTTAEFVHGKIQYGSIFYFNIGIFLYYSGAFMLFLFSNFTLIEIKSQDDFFVIWGLHASLVLIMNLLFSIGYILCKK